MDGTLPPSSGRKSTRIGTCGLNLRNSLSLCFFSRLALFFRGRGNIWAPSDPRSSKLKGWVLVCGTLGGFMSHLGWKILVKLPRLKLLQLSIGPSPSDRGREE